MVLRDYERSSESMEIREVWEATPVSAKRRFRPTHSPDHEQGQNAFPKVLVAGDVIRVWHLCAAAFFVRRRCHRPSRGIADSGERLGNLLPPRW
jgi:hypothetical protein